MESVKSLIKSFDVEIKKSNTEIDNL